MSRDESSRDAMKRYAAVGVVVAGAALIGGLDTRRCELVYLRYGLTMSSCPTGTIRQTASLDVRALRRGADGFVTLRATAHYTVDRADAAQSTTVPEIDSVALTLVDAKGTATPLVAGTWSGGTATVRLPEVPDGDYQLHAHYETKLGPGELEVPVPLYTPARVHVITDRPLYEPGNVVKFRAVVLRARDLAPIDGRPGRWVVKDPNGEVLLEEKAPATAWGVVAGSFPLDKGAPTGDWHVAWESGSAVDDVAIKVEPFKLPRFRVDATADKAFYQVGDKPTIRGAVLYSSGAPVANAKLEIAWTSAGEWPPPTEWQATLLPKQAQTGANGRFELALPSIPADLQGQATLSARIAAIDAAGDRVEGRAQVLLAQDGISVSAVTELGEGLVEGFNNRLYVRVATPDGQVVRKTKIHLTRAWEQDDKGIEAETDEDGVASVQVDPGAPVNIVIPARPYRPQPRPALVTRDAPAELIGGDGAPLADQVEMDRWLAPLGACAKWVGATGADDEGGGSAARIGMRVSAAGSVVTVGAAGDPLGQCVAAFVRGRSLPAGAERLYTVSFQFQDPELPTLSASVESALDEPEGLDAAVANLAKSTRDCLPRVEGALPRSLTWRVKKGDKAVDLGPWIDNPGGGEAGAALACVTSHFGARIPLAEPYGSDALGIVRFEVSEPATQREMRPQPTAMLGYELVVSADLAGKPATKLRVKPGQIPNLRLRVTPILAAPGEPVTAELIRGPNYRGSLPEKLRVSHLKGTMLADVDKESHVARFTLDPKAEGWVEVTGPGVRSLVYVKPLADLSVSVEPEQTTYKPGDQAKLVLQTKVAGKGAAAAVSLIGVDQSLGQLVALPGADSMARVQPKVETATPAFGLLDGQALALGRIRGANAAAATVLRVTSIPKPPELDAEVSGNATSRFDPIEELTDHFYTVLAELHVQTRAWETSSPAQEKMRPATMARLWSQALDAVEKRGAPVTDAYGRRLGLALLPQDLLALTDPRAVVVLGTRLPEDTENWADWVAKEKP